MLGIILSKWRHLPHSPSLDTTWTTKYAVNGEQIWKQPAKFKHDWSKCTGETSGWTTSAAQHLSGSRNTWSTAQKQLRTRTKHSVLAWVTLLGSLRAGPSCCPLPPNNTLVTNRTIIEIWKAIMSLQDWGMVLIASFHLTAISPVIHDISTKYFFRFIPSSAGEWSWKCRSLKNSAHFRWYIYNGK